MRFENNPTPNSIRANALRRKCYSDKRPKLFGTGVVFWASIAVAVTFVILMGTAIIIMRKRMCVGMDTRVYIYVRVHRHCTSEILQDPRDCTFV